MHLTAPVGQPKLWCLIIEVILNMATYNAGELESDWTLLLQPIREVGDEWYDRAGWAMEGMMEYTGGNWRYTGIITARGFGHFYMDPVDPNDGMD